MYEQLVGVIGEGMHLHHVCGVKRCVNPAHLLEVTPREHINLYGHGAKTHCKRGHELIQGSRQKRCRVCEAEWMRNFRAART